jgi:hypothetical protein
MVTRPGEQEAFYAQSSGLEVFSREVFRLVYPVHPEL